jgi:hypothetical protein
MAEDQIKDIEQDIIEDELCEDDVDEGDIQLTDEQLELHKKIQSDIDSALDGTFNEPWSIKQNADGSLQTSLSKSNIPDKQNDEATNPYDYTDEATEALTNEKLFFGSLMIYRKIGHDARRFAENARLNISQTEDAFRENFDAIFSELPIHHEKPDTIEFVNFKEKYKWILTCAKLEEWFEALNQSDPDLKTKFFERVFGNYIISELKEIVDDYEANSNLAEGLLNASFAHDAKVKGILLNEIKRVGDLYIESFKFDKWAKDNISSMGKTTRDKYMRIARRTDCHEYLILGVDRVDNLCSKTERKVGEKYVRTEDISTLLGRYKTIKVNLNNLKESSKERWAHFIEHIKLVTMCETIGKSICDNKETRKKSKNNPALQKKLEDERKQIGTDIFDITLKLKKTDPNFKPSSTPELADFVKKAKKKKLDGKTITNKEIEKKLIDLSDSKNKKDVTHKFTHVEETLIELDDYLIGLKKFISNSKKNKSKIDIYKPDLMKRLDLISSNIVELKDLAKKGL